MVKAFPGLTEDERLALACRGIDIEASLRSWLGSLLDEDPHSQRVDELIAAGNEDGLRVMAAEDTALSQRETEILALSACGHTFDEIADEIQLSVETVKSHAQRLRRKLGARNTTHAVTLGIARGVFDEALAA